MARSAAAVILIEITVAIDQFGTLQTLYVSDGKFTTTSSETTES